MTAIAFAVVPGRQLRSDIPAGFETWGRTHVLAVNARL
jgi:hypothetical protein